MQPRKSSSLPFVHVTNRAYLGSGMSAGYLGAALPLSLSISVSKQKADHRFISSLLGANASALFGPSLAAAGSISRSFTSFNVVSGNR